MTSTISQPTKASLGALAAEIATAHAAVGDFDPRIANALYDVAAAAIVDIEALQVDVAAGLTASKRTVTVGHADLDAAATSQTINIGATLPANARIVGYDIRALTIFTGGGAGAVTVDVGTSGDIDAIVDGSDLFAAAVDGGPSTMPLGIRPNKTFITAAAQLIATFVADVDVADLTTGSVVIDVLYVVLA